MDLISQYSSSFSEDNDEEQRCKRHKKNDQESEKNFPKVVLLTSPTDHNGLFRRTKPHIKGNWSGHIYFRLDGKNGGSYGNANELVYERLKDHVMDIIHVFQTRLEAAIRNESEPGDIADQEHLGRGSDILIMPHLRLGQGKYNTDDHHSSVEKSHGCTESSSPSKSSSSSEKSDSDSDTDGDDDEDGSSNCDGLRPLHVSLSRPFYMQYQSIEPFLSEVRERVRIQQQHPIAISVSARKYEVLTNDEKTRSFLTVPIKSHHTISSSAPIQKLVAILDGIFLKFGLMRYYPDPKFHISIASWVYQEKITEMSLKLVDDLSHEGDAMDDADDFLFSISGMHCIFGNTQEHHIPFG